MRRCHLKCVYIFATAAKYQKGRKAAAASLGGEAFQKLVLDEDGNMQMKERAYPLCPDKM